jgi:hypothetical protein
MDSVERGENPETEIGTMAETIPRGSRGPIELEVEEGSAGQEFGLTFGDGAERIVPLTKEEVGEDPIEKSILFIQILPSNNCCQEKVTDFRGE